MILYITGAVIALVAGVWVGLGHPGVGGREDRVVESGRARRLERKQLYSRRPEASRRRR